MDKIINRSRNFYYNNKKELFTALVSTYVLGLIAHAYGFLNNIFSHDSLNALYADITEEKWKIALGRFIVPVFRMFRGPVSLPLIIGLSGVFYVFLSTFLIIKMLNINSKPIIVIVSGLMITNITFTACTATYIYELDFDMFALLLAVCSVYMWKNRKGIVSVICSVCLMILSLGIYQSNITVITTLMIIVLIFNILDGHAFSDVFKKGAIGVSMTAVSAVIYYAVSKLLPAVMHVTAESRTDALNVSDSLSQNVTFFNSFNAMVYYEIDSVINPASVLPKPLTTAANIILIFFGTITALFLIIRLGKNKTKEKILLAALFAMLPFSIGFIEILTKGSMHELMIFSFWFIPILILLLTFKINKNKSHGNFKKNAAATVSIICIAITIWNNILVANTAYLKKDLELTSTISALNRVVADLEDRDDYSVGETQLCFIGSNFLSSNEPGFESVKNIEGLEFTSSIGIAGKSWYYSSYDKFFRYFLNYPVNITDRSFITQGIHDKIMEMPSFPSDGYIQNFNGILVIKSN